jgi:hypothetical protein
LGTQYHGSGPGGHKLFDTRKEYMNEKWFVPNYSGVKFYTTPGYNYVNGMIIGGSWGLLTTLLLFKRELFQKE